MILFSNGKCFSEINFSLESEYEKEIFSQSKGFFGKNSILIDTKTKIKSEEVKVRRTYKRCKYCESVEEFDGDVCLKCGKGAIKFDPNKRTLYFKVKKWRRRCNQSAYNRDKMKDLMQK